MDTCNIGFIGTSWITEWMHAPTASSHPNAKTIAICGRDEERTSSVAARLGIPKSYTDWRELIADRDLDAVVISTPDDLHHPMAMAATKRGLHVVCEKPLANTAAQAFEMYSGAAERNLVTMTYFSYCWVPVFAQIRQLVADGYVGRPHYFFIELNLFTHFGVTEYHWGYDRSRATGVLGAAGSHAIHYAQWIMGNIGRVVTSERAVFPYEPEGQPDYRQAADSAALLVEFASGAHGCMHITMNALEFGCRIYVHGDGGALELHWCPDLRIDEVRGRKPGDDSSNIIPVGEPYASFQTNNTNPLARAMEFCRTQPAAERLFVDGVLSGRSVKPDFLDGLRVQEVIDAALRSVESGRFEEVERHPETEPRSVAASDGVEE